MFDFIKSTYKKGDKLKLTCANGEFIGEILFISEDSIILKTQDGKTCGIKGAEISVFEEISKSVCDDSHETKLQNHHSVENSIIEEKTQDNSVASEPIENETSSLDEKDYPATEKNDKSELKRPELKIVGKIDLSALNLANRPKKTKVSKGNWSRNKDSQDGDIFKDSVNNPDQDSPSAQQDTDQDIEQVKIKSAQSKKTLRGLSSLQALADEMRKQENEKLVPAIGHIKFVIPERNYGFIRDAKTGNDFYFRMDQLIDSRIVDKSPIFLEALPVIYSVQKNARGDIATSIHRPGSINELLSLAKSLAVAETLNHSFHVLEHILEEYPDNDAALELQKKLKKEKRKVYANKSSAHANNNVIMGNYDQAKKYAFAKEYHKAIDYYIKAINNNERLESSIKDLGMLYAQLYKMGGEKADTYRDYVINLINNHRNNLPNSVSTLYYLENLLYAVQAYEVYIEVANQLLLEQNLVNSKSRSSIILCKIATAYLGLKDKDNALQTLEKSLLENPENKKARKLKDVIENEADLDVTDIINDITDIEFDLQNNGLSSYIQQTLNEYNEYAGVKDKTKESGKFTKKDLSDVRVLIRQSNERKFRGRPSDRAKYLLTEAKLMLQLEPDNAFEMRSVLARFCNDMSKIHIYNNSSPDIVRFFYNEAFALEEEYISTAQQVYYYLLTMEYDNQRLASILSKGRVDIDAALKIVLSGKYKQKNWKFVLEMFLYNSQIFKQIVEKIYNNPNYYAQSIQAFSDFGIKDAQTNQKYDKEKYIEIWEIARDIRLREYKEALAALRSIEDSLSIEELASALPNIMEIRKNYTWITARDNRNILTLINSILPALSSYISSTGYRSKESSRNNAAYQISELKTEIINGPTKLSYDAVLPLLEKASMLLDESFQDVKKLSEPKIEISLLSESTIIHEDESVSIQVSIRNHPDSSPIKEVNIEVNKSDSVISNYKSEVYNNLIEGGESQIFKLQFLISKDVIAQKATPITLTCNYKTGEDLKSVSTQMTLKLYSQEEFTPIENPYAPLADGGPVPVESNMFYGREKEIEDYVEAIIQSPSKQIIIYGQKRSGKSSVMFRLKERLHNTGKCFCVLFSLGDIINNLNEVSFYHKILSSIKQELDFLVMDGETNVPSFDIPSVNDFKAEDEDNPLNTFSKYMIRFKLSCKQTEGWQDKNLVVMIDEFTYLYTGIKKGRVSDTIMQQWKAITQNPRAQFSVVLVGQDVVPSFKKESYASNAFGVIEDKRLTYLKEEPARALIEAPILDENGNSRYIGDAVSRIIDYTSRNPYYIQIFCSRLVEYMNNNKLIRVTEADVNDVARSFIYGSDALEEDKFDNLIRAGESEDLQEYSEADILAVLRQIAINSKNIGYCNRFDINAIEDKDVEDAILKDLYDREVLDMRGENNYKIQVKLFQEWLLNH